MAKNGINNLNSPITQRANIQPVKQVYTAPKGIFGRSVKWVSAPVQYMIPITAKHTVINVPKGWNVRVIKNPVMYYPPMSAPQPAQPSQQEHYIPGNNPQNAQQKPRDPLRNEYYLLRQQNASIDQDHVLKVVATCLRPSLEKKGFKANTVPEAKAIIQELKKDMDLKTIRHVEDLVHSINSYDDYIAFRSKDVTLTSNAPQHGSGPTEPHPTKIETNPVPPSSTTDIMADEPSLLTIAGRNIFDSEEPSGSVQPPVATSDTRLSPDNASKKTAPASPQEPTGQKNTAPLAPNGKKTPLDQHADKTLNQSSSTRTKPKIPPKPEHLVRNFAKTKTTTKQPADQNITPNKTTAASSLPETTAQSKSSTIKTNTEKANTQPTAETQNNTSNWLDNRENAQVTSDASASADSTRHESIAALQTDQVNTATPQAGSQSQPPKSRVAKFTAFFSQLFQRQSKTDADLASIEPSSVKSSSSIASRDTSDVADQASQQEIENSQQASIADNSLDETDYDDDDYGWDPDDFDDDLDDDFDETPGIPQTGTSSGYENINTLPTYENTDVLTQSGVNEKTTATEYPRGISSHGYENLRALNKSDSTHVMMSDTVTAPNQSELKTGKETLNNPQDEQGNSSLSPLASSLKAALEARELSQKTNTPEKNTDVDSESLSQAGTPGQDVTLPKAQDPKAHMALSLEAIKSKQYKLKPVDETTTKPNAPTDIRSTTNTAITARRGAVDGDLSEEIEGLFDEGYYPDSDSEEAQKLIEQVKNLILNNSDLLPEQAQEAAQKIYVLDDKNSGEIENIIDEMRS